MLNSYSALTCGTGMKDVLGRKILIARSTIGIFRLDFQSISFDNDSKILFVIPHESTI
jgi:hypothetical protein